MRVSRWEGVIDERAHLGPPIECFLGWIASCNGERATRQQGYRIGRRNCRVLGSVHMAGCIASAHTYQEICFKVEKYLPAMVQEGERKCERPPLFVRADIRWQPRPFPPCDT